MKPLLAVSFLCFPAEKSQPGGGGSPVRRRGYLPGRVGNDIFGKQPISHLHKEGIKSHLVVTDPGHPSGVALITVDATGENSIVVASGANGSLSTTDIDRAGPEITHSDVVLFQLETPLETVLYGIRKSFEMNRRVVLNPAPAQTLPDAIFPCLYLITPNETEAEILTGIRVTDNQTTRQAAEILRAKGVQHVVLTLGSKGAYLQTDSQSLLIPAPTVSALDTTAAGDVFNGALSVAIAENRALEEAVAFACTAAAISVTRMGAQASAPYRREINAWAENKTLSA